MGCKFDFLKQHLYDDSLLRVDASMGMACKYWDLRVGIMNLLCKMLTLQLGCHEASVIPDVV